MSAKTLIPFKEWCFDEARRKQTSPVAIQMQIRRGKYPLLKIISKGRNDRYVKI